MPYLVEISEAQRETLYDQSTENTGGTIFWHSKLFFNLSRDLTQSNVCALVYTALRPLI